MVNEGLIGEIWKEVKEAKGIGGQNETEHVDGLTGRRVIAKQEEQIKHDASGSVWMVEEWQEQGF